MQELIAQMNNVPLSREGGGDFGYNMGQILSPKDLVATQYGSGQPQSLSYLQ